MPTSYTSLLGLALPVTGELSGAWGNTVNDSITSLLDTAVAGTTTLSSDADVTLSTTTGAANQARQAVILWTAGGTVTRNITAPAASKAYVVINKTSSTQSIVIRGVGPTTGVTVRAGQQALVVWDGLDFVEVASGNVDGPASSTDNAVVRFDGTTGKLIQDSTATIDDSGNFVATGNVNSSAATATVFSTPTNLTVGAAATTLSLGAATGTTAINNTTVTASNATTVSLGAATGTTSINNATVTLGNATTLNMNGANPTVASTATGTLTLFNTALTTANAFGAATTIALGITGTTARTVNIATGATSASTFTFGGAATSATHVIKIGTGSGGTATFDAGNAGSIGRLFPTITTGAINIAAGQTTGSLAVMGAQTSGTFTLGGTASTGAITIGQSTGAQTINIGTGVNTAATKTINIGTNGTTGTTNIRIGTDSANLRLPFHTDLGNSTQLWSAADYVLALGDIGAIRATTGSVAVTTNVYYDGTNFIQTDGSQPSNLAYFYLGGLQTKYAAAGGTSGAAVTMNDVWSLSYNGLIGYSQGGANVPLTCSGADLQVYDDNFAFANNTDATKKAFFDASGITTGTTRTYTLPNIDGTLATVANISQTFTGPTSIIPTNNGADIRIGAIPQTGTVTVGRSQVTHTLEIGVGATLSGSTKTINFGTAGLSGSTTTINIGSAVSGSTTTTAVNGNFTAQGVTVGLGGGAISTNTAVGASALAANTTGTFNTAIGASALSAVNSNNNTAIGTGALQSATTGANNSAIGASALSNLVTGNQNTALGDGALTSLNGYNSNVAVGKNAMSSAQCSEAVGIGFNALAASTGAANVAVGSQTMQATTSGGFNTAVGYQSLITNSTGAGNTAVGSLALNLSTGQQNIGIGYNAGSSITTGSNNVVIGSYTGSGGPISATGSNWIVLSDGAGNVRQSFDSSGNSQMVSGAAVVYCPTPTTISAAGTLTNADIQAQIINTTGTTYTLTMPLGTTLETLIPWSSVNLGYDFYVLNTASGTVTMAANTGVTIVGRTTVLTNIAGQFRIRRTAANTFIVYRIN